MKRRQIPTGSFASFMLSILLLTLPTACVNTSAVATKVETKGEIQSASFDLPQFTKIHNLTAADINVTHGKKQEIKVEAEKKDLENISLEVDLSTLVINDQRKDKFTKSGDIKIYITVDELKQVQNDGTGDFEFDGRNQTKEFKIISNGTGDIDTPSLSVNDLQILLNGTGDVSVAGKADIVDVELNGTGDMDLGFNGMTSLNVSLTGTGDFEGEGTVKNASFSLSGTGNISAKKLKALSVKANLSGSGNITCYAADRFEGNREGNGDITCLGNPPFRNMDAEGYSFPQKK